MAQQLRMLAALAEDLMLVPNIHITVYNSFGFLGHLHSIVISTHRHEDMLKNNKDKCF